MDAVPDYAEPVITTPAQLRSSPGAHSRDPLVPMTVLFSTTREKSQNQVSD